MKGNAFTRIENVQPASKEYRYRKIERFNGYVPRHTGHSHSQHSTWPRANEVSSLNSPKLVIILASYTLICLRCLSFERSIAQLSIPIILLVSLAFKLVSTSPFRPRLIHSSTLPRRIRPFSDDTETCRFRNLNPLLGFVFEK